MEVSMPLFYITFFLTIVSTVTYFVYKKKKNYIDFDTLFIFICILICFFSTFFYNEDFYYLLFLNFRFDESYINSGSLISSIGLQSYFVGSLVPNSRKRTELPVGMPQYIINTGVISLCILIGILLFFAVGGIDYYKSMYQDDVKSGSALSTYVILLITVLSIVLIATEFYNSQICSNYKIKKSSICILVIFCVLLMFSGNRTSASHIILPIIGLYALFKRKLNLRYFFVFLFGSILLMWLFQNIRSNRDIEMSGTNPVMILRDLTIPSRATFAAMEYVDSHGYTYGETMCGGLVGIIPLFASTFNFNMDKLGSAEVLTIETYDNLRANTSRMTGLGTTVITDIYLSFGVLGVIVLMFFLGYFVCVNQSKSLNLDYYSLIIYTALLSNSVFLARASFTHPVRYILWALVVAYIFRKKIVIRTSQQN